MNRYDELLRQVAEEVFESLAFLLLLSEEEASPLADAPRVVAKVEFTGAFDGALFIGVSRDMLEALSANMLGMEEDYGPPPDQQGDALKELLNVVCGNLLPKIAGAEAVFDVCAPEIFPDKRTPETFSGRSAAAKAGFDLDVGEADLALFVPDRVLADAGATAR